MNEGFYYLCEIFLTFNFCRKFSNKKIFNQTKYLINILSSLDKDRFKAISVQHDSAVYVKVLTFYHDMNFLIGK